MLNYIIGAIGAWTIIKYGQIMFGYYILNYPLITTRFEAQMNQLKTD